MKRLFSSVFAVFAVILVMAFFGVKIFSIVEDTSVVVQKNSGATLSAVSISSLESSVLNEINLIRVQAGLIPLSSNSTMQDIAVFRTTDMQQNQYYSHTSPNRVSFSDMIKKGSGLACENLLLTESDSAEKIVDEWINSPSHRDCLLSERTTLAGISIGKFDQSVDSTLETQIVTFIASER